MRHSRVIKFKTLAPFIFTLCKFFDLHEVCVGLLSLVLLHIFDKEVNLWFYLCRKRSRQSVELFLAINTPHPVKGIAQFFIINIIIILIADVITTRVIFLFECPLSIIVIKSGCLDFDNSIWNLKILSQVKENIWYVLSREDKDFKSQEIPLVSISYT